jgi:ferredoxin-NADP reductase
MVATDRRHSWQDKERRVMENVTTGYRVKLLEKTQVAEGTLAFSVEKPDGFVFRAGQAAELTLVDPPETDDEGNARTFSIVAAPSENVLTFATRLRDTAFKRVLRNLPAGTELLLDGPFGSFNLHKNRAKPAVFLAGGIGITPFVSMIRDASKPQVADAGAAGRPDPYSIYLFYSNRRPEDAAFLDQLAAIPQGYCRFRLIATMTDLQPSAGSWEGERGFIDAPMLLRHLPTLDGPIYYVAGPPQMVTAMRDMLVKAKVDEDAIRTEDFGGY